MAITRWINHTTGDSFQASHIDKITDTDCLEPNSNIMVLGDQHLSHGDIVEEMSYCIEPTYSIATVTNIDASRFHIKLEPFFSEYVVFWKLTDEFGNEVEDSGILEATSSNNAASTARYRLRCEYNPIKIEYICIGGVECDGYGEIHFDRFIYQLTASD